MVRELRQTFTTARARTGDTVGAVLLVGGGSRLRGLASFVSENLGVPAYTLGAADAAAVAGPRVPPEGIDGAAMTVALAHDAATGRPMFDLRSGDLAFKVDLSFLRAKAVPLAAAVLLVIAFAGISAFASLYRLKRVESVLTERISRETKDQFHEARTAEQLLKSSDAQPVEVSPLPKESAYDLLLEINAKLPGRDKVTLDVTQLDISKDKVSIRGSAKTDEEIDQIFTAIKDIKCFSDITPGTRETGTKGERRFQLTMTSACM
jgi:general secretion pathway protein L